jgi:hypothetical protein
LNQWRERSFLKCHDRFFLQDAFVWNGAESASEFTELNTNRCSDSVVCKLF